MFVQIKPVLVHNLQSNCNHQKRKSVTLPFLTLLDHAQLHMHQKVPGYGNLSATFTSFEYFCIEYGILFQPLPVLASLTRTRQVGRKF